MNADSPYRASSQESLPFEPLRVLDWLRRACVTVATWPILILNVFVAWAYGRYTSIVTVAYGVPRWMRQRPRRIAWWLLQVGFRKALMLCELLPIDQNGALAPLAWALLSVALYMYPIGAFVLIHERVGQTAVYFAAGIWAVYRLIIAWLQIAMHFDEWPAYERWQEWFQRV